MTRPKRAFSVRDVTSKKWETLPWGGRWSEVFGHPAVNASWCVSGTSASGKSSFVMQLAKELCKYGLVLYVSYEEGVRQTFQRRLEYLKMSEVQGKFRILDMDKTYDDVVEYLRKPKSPKFVIVDSVQVSGWSYEQIEDLIRKVFPRKSFIFVSQVNPKGGLMGNIATSTNYIADMKVRVSGYKAVCLGRESAGAGKSFDVWEDGLIRTGNFE